MNDPKRFLSLRSSATIIAALVCFLTAAWAADIGKDQTDLAKRLVASTKCSMKS